MIETLETAAMFILPGMVGGLVRGIVGIGKHVIRDKEQFNIFKLIFSITVATIAGTVAALVAGGDWKISLLAGFAGADLLESLYKSKLMGMFKVS